MGKPVEIPEKLHREYKMLAFQADMSIQLIVTQILSDFLQDKQKLAELIKRLKNEK